MHRPRLRPLTDSVSCRPFEGQYSADVQHDKPWIAYPIFESVREKNDPWLLVKQNMRGRKNNQKRHQTQYCKVVSPGRDGVPGLRSVSRVCRPKGGFCVETNVVLWGPILANPSVFPYAYIP